MVFSIKHLIGQYFFFFLILSYLFIWLCRVLVAAGGLLSGGSRTP